MDLFIQGIKHLIAVVSGVTLLVFPANNPPSNLPSPAPITQQIINAPSPNPSDIITTSGEYSYLGQGVTYNVSFPINGGEVHGSLGGMCHDSFINGRFNGGDGGKIEGNLFAWCGVAFVQQRLTASYTGNVYLKAGRVDVNWEGNTQFSSGKGSYSLNFHPID